MDCRSTLMWKELNEAPNVILSCIKNNTEIISQIAKIVLEKDIKHIYAVGRGTSNHALVFFKYVMEVMVGIPVTLGACSVVTLYGGAIDLSSSLVVGCSQSGKAVDVCEVLKKANSQNAVTVAVTNYKDSCMAGEANYHIHLAAGEEESVAATKTFTAQLCAFLHLTLEISKLKFGSMVPKLDTFAQIDLLKIDKITTETTQKMGKFDNCFVLGRGIFYALALETALKLQETSYMAVKGYPTSEFYHGPMAMVEKDTPIIIFAPKFGETDSEIFNNIVEDEIRIIDKMLSLDAKVLLITDNKLLADKYNDSCLVAFLPSSDNGFPSIFNYVMFVQMFACKVSTVLGRNPDKPRALKKVTITK